MVTSLLYALPKLIVPGSFRYIYIFFRYQKQGYPLIPIVQDEQSLKTISLTNLILVKYFGQFWLQ